MEEAKLYEAKSQPVTTEMLWDFSEKLEAQGWTVSSFTFMPSGPMLVGVLAASKIDHSLKVTFDDYGGMNYRFSKVYKNGLKETQDGNMTTIKDYKIMVAQVLYLSDNR